MGVARAHLQLQPVGDVIADLTEDGGGFLGRVAPQIDVQDVFRETDPVFGGGEGLGRETGHIVLVIEAQQPCQALLIRRDQVELLRPDLLVQLIDEGVVQRRCAVQIGGEARAAGLIAGDRLQRHAAVEHIADIQRRAHELVVRLVRTVRGDVERVVGRQRRIGRIAAQIDVVVIGLPQHLQRVGRLPQQAGAHAVGIHHAGMTAIGAGDGVEAVARLVIEGQARRQGVAKRQVDRALQLDVVIVSGLAEDIAVDAREVGIARGDEDGAAGRIGPRKGALRPPQQL